MKRNEREELAWIFHLAEQAAGQADNGELDQDEIVRIRKWVFRRLNAFDRIRNVVTRTIKDDSG